VRRSPPRPTRSKPRRGEAERLRRLGRARPLLVADVLACILRSASERRLDRRQRARGSSSPSAGSGLRACTPPRRFALTAKRSSPWPRPYRRLYGARPSPRGGSVAVAEKTLVDLRLRGWLPADAVRLPRALAAWYELNIETASPLRRCHAPRLELGSLAVVWPRAAKSQSSRSFAGRWCGRPGAIRAARRRPSWGLGLRLAGPAASREEAPAARWAAGAASCSWLGIFVIGCRWKRRCRRCRRSGRAGRRRGRCRLVASMPPAAWIFDGSTRPGIWRAEANWWNRSRDRGAFAHAGRRCGPTPSPVRGPPGGGCTPDGSSACRRGAARVTRDRGGGPCRDLTTRSRSRLE
jgi:hypothetical protein